MDRPLSLSGMFRMFLRINFFLKVLGCVFLALAKLKSLSVGYTRSRPFSSGAIEQAIAYDLKVVEEWLGYLREYRAPHPGSIHGRRVLELGPGPDLGVGLFLLGKGAASYCALDAFPLALSAPLELHQRVAERVTHTLGVDGRALLEELPRQDGADESRRIRYLVRADFDIEAACAGRKFDLVFSQAAFEHFDLPSETIRKLTSVVEPGGVLIAGIDLQTHTRWIREKDPLSIYRYSDRFYRLLGFKGMPNRVLTSEYVRALEDNGWTNIVVHRVYSAPADYVTRTCPGLSPRFRREEIANLWIVMCATRQQDNGLARPVTQS